VPTPPSLDPARGHRGRGPTLLPAEGRRDPAPEWPLPGKPTAAERAAWQQLWATPQAVAWEKLGWTRTVGRYARLLVRAEARGATPALQAQTTALEDRLGLTPKSMRLLLWSIATDEVAEKREEQSTSARGRIKAVG
jgi:hypothetical protein